MTPNPGPIRSQGWCNGNGVCYHGHVGNEHTRDWQIMSENMASVQQAFTDEQMDTMKIAARMTLREVTSRADDLRRHLEDARRDAARGLEEMAKGQRVSGSWSNGPLGHQLPFDIARATNRLEAALEQAQMYRHLGFYTDDDIEAAYLAGAKAGR